MTADTVLLLKHKNIFSRERKTEPELFIYIEAIFAIPKEVPMNEQEYREAVRQIRWSDEKRKKLEAFLSKPYDPSDSANEWPESAEHHKIVVTYDSAKRTEAIELKKHKSTKLLLLGIAAALIATGGAVAAVAGNFRDRTKTLDITHENGTVLHLTDENNIPYYKCKDTIQYSLNRYDEPKTFVTPVEGGCFYYQETVSQGKEDYILMYTDFASGQSVPVCAKPNCKHDGSEFCTASSRVYAPSHLEYHDGYLYSMTTKFLHPENRDMSCSDLGIHGMVSRENDAEFHPLPPEEGRQVLLRYSPDGTQIEELHDFGSGIGVSDCIYHRGYIWCIVQLQSSGEKSENGITGDTSSFVNGGWQLWGYEVATGKTVCLANGMTLPDKNHVNNKPVDFVASGDYLYLSRDTFDWSGSTGNVVRISLLTGKEEPVVSGDDYAGGLTQEKAFCYGTRKIKGVQLSEYFTTNLLTGEKTEPRAIMKQMHSETGVMLLLYPFMDDEYIFLSKEMARVPGESTKIDLDAESESSGICVYDSNLNLVAQSDIILNMIDDMAPDTKPGVIRLTGQQLLFEYQSMLYVQEYESRLDETTGLEAAGSEKNNKCTIKRFPVSDLLNGGDAHYETVCSYEY